MKWPPPKKFPLVTGRVPVNDQWSIELTEQFARRVDNGSLVHWRPGVTVWCDAFGNANRTSRSARLREIKPKLAPRAKIIREASDPTLTRLVVRVSDATATPPLEAVQAFVFSDDGHLQLAIQFESDEATALAIANSVQFSR